MTDMLLTALQRQALLLTIGVLLVLVLRTLLLKRLGARASYAVWLLVPAMLVTPILPRPAQEPLRLMLQTATADASWRPPLAVLSQPEYASPWLLLWLGGAALVLLGQALR